MHKGTVRLGRRHFLGKPPAPGRGHCAAGQAAGTPQEHRTVLLPAATSGTGLVLAEGLFLKALAKWLHLSAVPPPLCCPPYDLQGVHPQDHLSL